MIDIEIFLDGISKGYCTFNGENYTIKSLGYNITSKTYLVESLKNKYILKTLVEPNEIVKTCETRQNVPAGKVLTKPVSYV